MLEYKNLVRLSFLSLTALFSEIATADRQIYLHQTKAILIERDNEFGLSLSLASTKFKNDQKIEEGSTNDYELETAFGSEGVFASLRPIENVELGLELTNIYSQRNMYMLVSAYKNAQIEFTTSLQWLILDLQMMFTRS